MGFFDRLKWLMFGTGEAPSSFKSQNSKRPESGATGRHGASQAGRDRDHRDHRDRGEGRDSRGGRYQQRGDRQFRQSGDRQREAREPREGGRDSRDHRGGSERGGRYSQRSPESRHSGHGRRDSQQDFDRPIARPSGGPSSTMMPSISSAAANPNPAPVVETAQRNHGPEKVGQVTNYFDQVKVAGIKLESGSLRAGDWIEIQGQISSLRQKIDSIQIDNQPVAEAHAGQEIGLRVIRPVKAGDAIVKLRS